MFSATIKTTLIISTIAVLGAGLTGCGGNTKMAEKNKVVETELVIPDFPTAKEQFMFAKMFQSSQVTNPELEKRRVQMNKVTQYYGRVIKNFPNDQTYVPLTYLELGDCAALSDDLQGAIQYYQQAQSASNDDFVQVRSQYSIARIYDTLERFEEAKAIYKRLMEQYRGTESGRVKDVLKRCYERYMMVQEKKV